MEKRPKQAFISPILLFKACQSKLKIIAKTMKNYLTTPLQQGLVNQGKPRLKEIIFVNFKIKRVFFKIKYTTMWM